VVFLRVIRELGVVTWGPVGGTHYSGSRVLSFRARALLFCARAHFLL
jgi:hypothetical protein